MKKRSLLPATLLCLLLIACGPSGPADKPDTTAAAENGEIVFSCGASFPADAEEIAAVLNEGETALLDEFSALKRVDASGSVCYAELAAYRAAHPEIDVRYTVDLGTPVDVNATEAALTGRPRRSGSSNTLPTCPSSKRSMCARRPLPRRRSRPSARRRLTWSWGSCSPSAASRSIRMRRRSIFPACRSLRLTRRAKRFRS